MTWQEIKIQKRAPRGSTPAALLVRMSEDLEARIATAAREDGITKSELVRTAVLEWLDVRAQGDE